MSTLLFIYGTLKRGCSNHHTLADQTFVGVARTVPGFRLFDLGGFPAIAALPGDREGVAGELWSVDDAALARLDAFEGVHEGIYRRARIALAAPFGRENVQAYFPAMDPKNRREVGNEWIES